MTKNVQIVIGGNYGDEGKGLITDFLTSQSDSDNVLIVRHNSGAQAAHTVQTPDGIRHVFHHFGSGSFLSARTYLSRFFVCNPILLLEELELLNSYGITPHVYVAPQSAITTPYDMMINQIVEEYRADNRHGSCGVGFGETVERNENSALTLHFNDLQDRNFLRKRLKEIQIQWVSERLSKLGVDHISDQWQEYLSSDGIFEHYIENVTAFLNTVQPAHDNILQQADNIIFEGAQGLLLDQDRGAFPYVTRSNTGIKNALTIGMESGITDYEVTYITRAYNTRHGAGPMDHELPEKPYENVIDLTNKYNQYQHNLRFGWLDIDLFTRSIHDDLSDAPASVNVTHNVAITCLDQIEEPHAFISNGTKKSAVIEAFITEIKKKTNAQKIITSYGPTRNDVSYHPD